MLIVLWQRRSLREFLFLDLTCLASIISVLVVNTTLGATLDLKAPFLNAIKYDYQALPFFSFLAAGLVTKSIWLFRESKNKSKIKKTLTFTLAALGIALVFATIWYNMQYTHLFSTWNYLIFRVDPNVNEGYSLFNSSPVAAGSFEMGLQLVGFAIAISGAVWLGRQKIKTSTQKLFARTKK